ncbi:DsbA family protein [Streptomyces carpaticus]|uniref:Thioredoxin n=2 Tax=Streptomyces TaxID=1883 RepID=A0A1I6QW80_9ACTN|nr:MULTISPECIES: DsbA family protein [Streptomyces]MCK1813095.1 DsbA family protein [Streptomyces sp. XM4011]QKV67795.1 DsbA family protein [Streptomyces harbinensis]UWM48082.1 DsbA family protein [Streptomyces carpaticus]SFS56685.1 Thioredoxin [Streptomyces harbinensis]
MSEATGRTVVLDVWCDLQCPDCHRAESDLRALRARFGDRLEIRRRHFPLANHQHALAAAQAAEEAYAQGRGEAYCEALLERTAELRDRGEPVLAEVAEATGVDPEEIATALIDGRHLLAVDADQAEGQALGVRGTPSYVIAGQRLDGGQSQDGLLERIIAIVEAEPATA